MRVLLLSPYPELLQAPLRACGDEIAASNSPPVEIDWHSDFVVMFGYRHILKSSILAALAQPIINIHISYLPWNKGADPNFWSWFDNTRKGVSIHVADPVVDTGPILAQSEVLFAEPERETLATSYDALRARAVKLFADNWSSLRAGKISGKAQSGGTFHRRKDKDTWWSLLPDGYDTPVSKIVELGSRSAVAQASREGDRRDR